MVTSNETIELMSNMAGPYELDAYGVGEALYGTGVSPGVYVLARRGFSGLEPLYVGRSDSNLHGRLVDHMIGTDDSPELRSASPKVYWYEGFPIAMYAFERECLLYHTGTFPLNRIHPAKPDEYSRCPVCWT